MNWRKNSQARREDINWAWAFSGIQQAPDHQIRVYFDDGKAEKAELLKDIEKVPDWYRWTRGIGGWEPAVELQKGESLGRDRTGTAKNTQDRHQHLHDAAVTVSR